MKFIVTGDQKQRVSKKLAEIQRQVFLQEEYGHDPELLIEHLQAATEGRFNGPQKEVRVILSAPQPIVTLPNIVKASETDLFTLLDKAESYSKRCFGTDVKLLELFNIPEELPWKSALPVYCPAGLDSREMINLLVRLGFKKPWESADVIRFSGSEASTVPTLRLIENSATPNMDTMGMSAIMMRETHRQFLSLRDYGLAMAFWKELNRGYLDPKETFTRFPEDRLDRHPDGGVAGGYWNPFVCQQVGFDYDTPGYVSPDGGGRVAIDCSLKT